MESREPPSYNSGNIVSRADSSSLETSNSRSNESIYQVIQVDGRSMLLNTQTGDTKLLSVVTENPKTPRQKEFINSLELTDDGRFVNKTSMGIATIGSVQVGATQQAV
jgi:hypothetical protein